MILVTFVEFPLERWVAVLAAIYFLCSSAGRKSFGEVLGGRRWVAGGALESYIFGRLR